MLRSFLLALAIASLCCSASHALIESGSRETVRDTGWPDGSLAVAKLRHMIGWYEGPPFGGGQTRCHYQTTSTRDFNQALELFSKIQAPELELFVYDGPTSNGIIRTKTQGRDFQTEKPIPYDWVFEVWAAEPWHMLHNHMTGRLLDGQPGPVPAPRIELYISDGGGVRWEQVILPPNVIVKDCRAQSLAAMGHDCFKIKGHVYDTANRKPIAALVTLGKPGPRGMVDPQQMDATTSGSFAFPRVTRGNYWLRAEAPGYAPRSSNLIQVPACEETTIYLSKTATLSGVVTDEQGRPLANIPVRAANTRAIDATVYHTNPLYGVDCMTSTSSDGRFSFETLPRGFTQLMCGEGQDRHIDYRWIDIPSENVQLKFPFEAPPASTPSIKFSMDTTSTVATTSTK
jgi:hypothetical protein